MVIIAIIKGFQLDVCHTKKNVNSFLYFLQKNSANTVVVWSVIWINPDFFLQQLFDSFEIGLTVLYELDTNVCSLS